MDYKLIWSPQAIEDIQAIAEYIARDSTIYAESNLIGNKGAMPRYPNRIPLGTPYGGVVHRTPYG